MTEQFEVNPILNTPYDMPTRHWELDDDCRPTGRVLDGRRTSVHLVPIPASERARRQREQQGDLGLEEKVKENPIINRIRRQVNDWRNKPADKQGITYITQKLLEHWKEGDATPRPFFCQVEAAETFIWLNEVAPNTGEGRRILDEIKEANAEANPGLLRYAAKMATGSGKTTVMAMLIAYHTINKNRTPASSRFSKNFLIISPGITIKDRLRVLLPTDPNSMYRGRGVVPNEFFDDIKKANIIITNYHTFRRRERLKMSPTARDVIRGNNTDDTPNLETEGEMIVRACGSLCRSKDIVVINDEAHHCYRHKIESHAEKMTTDELKDLEKTKEAARIWISGIEAINRKIRVRYTYDLSATPFFLKGSGYPEGQLFPWVTSDFALMDAIECGIVKLPRVPVDDGTVTEDNLPIYRNIYQHIKKELPKKRLSRQNRLDPATDMPSQLEGALTALYGNYRATYSAWLDKGLETPPVFIIVCNNTSTSKLILDHVAGYEAPDKPGKYIKGAFELFSNIGKNGKPLPHMNTLLIDSEQLDSGEAMSNDFKIAAATEIEVFKCEMKKRFPGRNIDKLSDEDILREVMNTVGKRGKLGEQIRCVISVSMLTEGWDTNNVTHILGVRAFGTQLLCEQVVGRGLRRYSYDLDTSGENQGKLSPEYADVLGVPFTFATGSKIGTPKAPTPQYLVEAIESRSHLEITFPQVRSYSVKPPDHRIFPNFDKNSYFTIEPKDAPPVTRQEGVVGEGITLNLDDLKAKRMNEVVFSLAAETASRFKDKDGNISPNVFQDIVPIVRRWIKEYVNCRGNTFKQYLLFTPTKKRAADTIYRACLPKERDYPEVYIPILDRIRPEGTTADVRFPTRNTRRHETRHDKCHVNIAVCDSNWELEFCETLEKHPSVFSYIRNEGLYFKVPYEYNDQSHNYEPDFIALVDDGHGKDDLLNLIVEIKGKREDVDRVKADTLNRCWLPSVNSQRRWGRWAFVEIRDMEKAYEHISEFTAAKTTRS